MQILEQILEYLVDQDYLERYLLQILQYLHQILQYLLQILEYLLRLNAPLATRSRRDRAHACLGARRAPSQHEEARPRQRRLEDTCEARQELQLASRDHEKR